MKRSRSCRCLKISPLGHGATTACAVTCKASPGEVVGQPSSGADAFLAPRARSLLHLNMQSGTTHLTRTLPQRSQRSTRTVQSGDYMSQPLNTRSKSALSSTRLEISSSRLARLRTLVDCNQLQRSLRNMHKYCSSRRSHAQSRSERTELAQKLTTSPPGRSGATSPTVRAPRSSLSARSVLEWWVALAVHLWKTYYFRKRQTDVQVGEQWLEATVRSKCFRREAPLKLLLKHFIHTMCIKNVED